MTGRDNAVFNEIMDCQFFSTILLNSNFLSCCKLLYHKTPWRSYFVFIIFFILLVEVIYSINFLSFFIIFLFKFTIFFILLLAVVPQNGGDSLGPLVIRRVRGRSVSGRPWA